MKKALFCFSLFLFLVNCFVDQPNLLFPVVFGVDRQIQIQISAGDGCFIWSNSKKSVLSLKLKENECQSKVLVEVVNSEVETSVEILAINKETREKSRIEAKISPIFRIDALTKTKSIEKGRSLTIEIVAFDKDGNVFSTLDKVNFEWDLFTCEEKIALETPSNSSLGRFRGLKKGTCEIQIKLKEQNYPEISKKIKLSIIEIFSITPKSEIYLTPASQFQLGIEIEDQKGLNSDYLWYLTDPNIAEVSSDGTIKTFEVGNTKLFVEDKTVSDMRRDVVVHVVDVASLKPVVKESDCNLEVGTVLMEDVIYCLEVKALDMEGNNIILTVNLNMKTTFISDGSIQLISQTKNTLVFKALKKTEELVFHSKLDNVEAKLNITILSHVRIVKPAEFIHLPFVPSDPSNHASLRLYAVGGSSNYIWTVRNSLLASINEQGVVKAKNIGESVIELKDALNPLNFDSIPLQVTFPHFISSLEPLKELLLHTPSSIFISASSSSLLPYTNCSSLLFSLLPSSSSPSSFLLPSSSPSSSLIPSLFHLKSLSPYFSQILPPLSPPTYSTYENELSPSDFDSIQAEYAYFGICAKIEILPLKVGEASYSFLLTPPSSSLPPPSSSPSSSSLPPTCSPIKIRVYGDLKGEESEVRLGLGATWDFWLVGGVYKWDERELIKRIEVLGGDGLKVEEEGGRRREGGGRKKEGGGLKDEEGGTWNYRVTCEEEGRYEIKVTIWNKADLSLPLPIKVNHSLLVVCSKPKNINIVPLNLLRHEDGIYLPNDPALYEFKVFIFSDQNTPFHNLSSSKLDWLLPSKSLQFTQQPPQTDLPLTHLDFTLRLTQDSEETDIELVVSYGSLLDSLTVRIRAVPVLELLPPKTSLHLYFNSDNTAAVQIKHGSGHYKINSIPEHIVKLTYNEKDKTIRISPLYKGMFQLAVTDTHLVYLTSVNGTVGGVSNIKLTTKQKYVLVDSVVKLRVQPYNELGVEYSETEYPYMEASLIGIGLQIRNKGMEFEVRGGLGVHKIRAKIEKSESNEVELNVIEPIRLAHDALRLILGCETTVQVYNVNSQLNLRLKKQSSSVVGVSIKEVRDNFYINVRGLEVGMEELVFLIVDGLGVEIMEVGLNVEVTDEFELDVLGRSERLVYIGRSTLRMIPIYKSKSEKEFSFAFCPFKFDWINLGSNLIRITESGLDNLHSAGTSNITTLHEGKADVLLKLDTSYKESSLAIELDVIRPLEADLHFGSKRLLLLPLMTKYKLKLNKPCSLLNIRILDSDKKPPQTINIDKDGLIQTWDRKGKHVILLDEIAEQSETDVVNVEITEVYSIIIEEAWKAMFLSPDQPIELKITLQDSFGRSFPPDLDDIKFTSESNNPYLLSIKFLPPSSILIVPLTLGHTLLKVVFSQKIFDVISVYVSSPFLPSSPVFVHKGGSFKFQLLFESSEFEFEAENEDILETKGLKIKAKEEGSTFVHLKNNFPFKAKVIVFEIDQFIYPSTLPIIIIPPGHPQYSGPVYKFSIDFKSNGRKLIKKGDLSENNQAQAPSSSNLIDNNLDFECEEENEQMKVHGEWDGSGEATCYIEGKRGEGVKDRIVIKNRVVNKEYRHVVREETLELQYYPFFEVQKEWRRERNERILNIHSITNLNYTTDSLKIEKYIQTSFDAINKVFTLRISNPPKSKAKIVVFDPFTHQTETIDFDSESETYKEDESFTPPSSNFNILDFIIMLLAVVALLFIGKSYLTGG